MALYSTRYGEPITRVLQAYPMGSKSLIVALEAIVKTAMDNTKAEARDVIATETCLNLHTGPGSGLVCRKCFDTLEAGRAPVDPEDLIPPTPEEQEEASQILKNVQSMINASGRDE